MLITIKIKESGPYIISLEDAASVVIVNSAGEVIEPTPGKAIALCRCGHSSRKPFCDATHRTCGFQGALAVPVAAPVPAVPQAPATPAATAMPPAPSMPAAHEEPAAPTIPEGHAAAAPPVTT